MKNTIYIMLVLALGACKQNTKTVTHFTSVIIDQTDSNALVERLKASTLSSMATPNNKYSGHVFQIDFITDKKHNAVYRYTLNRITDRLDFNEFTRKKEIKAYRRTIETKGFPFIRKQPIGSEYSLVFYTISQSINRCIQNKYSQSTLYVFSDLQNKSKEFNAYHKDDFALLKFEKDSVSHLLDKHFPIFKLKTHQTIDLVFLYAPKDKVDDESFDRMAVFLKEYYQHKGIQVSIHSSLNFSQK